MKKRKEGDNDTIPIQCECGEWKEVAMGSKEEVCDHCARGMEISWADYENEKEDKAGEKCYEVAYYHPYGGATSFNEADAWREALDTSIAVSSAKSMFDGIYDNIWADDEMSPDEKITATEKCMTDMIDRMRNPKKDKGWGERLKNLIGLGIGSGEEPAHCPAYLSVAKDSQGNLRWLTLFSNRFKDREKEIFSEEAHREYEEWVDKSKRFPELRVWHMPSTGLGRADSVTYADGFMMATGTFYEKSLDVAERLAGMEGVGVSHGFAHRVRDLSDDGVYHRYRTFEISVVPIEHAANPWTAFTLESLQKEVAMGLNEKKRPFFVELLGEDRVKMLEETLPQLNKDLEEAGVAWKDLDEALTSDSSAGEDNASGEGEDKSGEGEDKAGQGEEDKTGEEEKKGEDTGDEADKSLEAFKAVLAPVVEQITSIKEEIAELKKSDDEKISARMQQGKVANGNRPSESEDNTIDEDKTKKLDQADDDKQPQGQTAAARSIVDELLLGKRSQS